MSPIIPPSFTLFYSIHLFLCAQSLGYFRLFLFGPSHLSSSIAHSPPILIHTPLLHPSTTNHGLHFANTITVLTYHSSDTPLLSLFFHQQIYVTFPVRPSGPGAALSGKEAMFEGTYVRTDACAIK